MHFSAPVANDMIITVDHWRPGIQVKYRIIPLKDGTYVVEIDIPGTWPTTTCKTFATEAEAKAWLEKRWNR